MEVAGLALAVYKDVFYLSRSVYRLAVSAQHFEADQIELIEDFHSELLYLAAFHSVFFVSRGGQLVGNRQLDQALAVEIKRVVSKIQRLFSAYRGIAIEHDKVYRLEYEKLEQSNSSDNPLDFFASLNDLTEPEALPDSKSSVSKRISNFFTNDLKKVTQEQPMYKLEAWKWALFQKKELTQTIEKFRKYNHRLMDFVPLFLGLQRFSMAELRDFENEARANQNADYGPFLKHIKIRQVAEPDLDTADALEDSNRSVTPVQLELRQPQSSTRTWTEYKEYTITPGSPVSKITLGTDMLAPPTAKSNRSPLQRQAHQLARLLFEAGSYDLNTLPFTGYVNEPGENRFAFYFEYPDNATSTVPHSLNWLIANLAPLERLSLPKRFSIAVAITKALAAFHADGWVHKSYSSNAIFFFENKDGGFNYLKPYLTGFEFSRLEADETSNTFDTDPTKNLYRHPDRQGPPTAQFSRIHDIYSLGVVLLEIGVWSTVTSLSTSIRNAMTKRYGPDIVLSPEGLQKALIDNAKARLKHSMGDHYMDAVVTCLSGDLAPFLHQDNFALVFRKRVVEKIDPKRIYDL